MKWIFIHQEESSFAAIRLSPNWCCYERSEHNKIRLTVIWYSAEHEVHLLWVWIVHWFSAQRSHKLQVHAIIQMAALYGHELSQCAQSKWVLWPMHIHCMGIDGQCISGTNKNDPFTFYLKWTLVADFEAMLLFIQWTCYMLPTLRQWYDRKWLKNSNVPVLVVLMLCCYTKGNVERV